MLAVNSPVTKQKYTYRLTKLFDFINIERERDNNNKPSFLNISELMLFLGKELRN
jgi:hypothetical protein